MGLAHLLKRDWRIACNHNAVSCIDSDSKAHRSLLPEGWIARQSAKLT